MTNNYGLTAANGTARDALTTVRRWNDGVNRHTLFTACGTSQDGWGFFNDPGTAAGRDGLIGLYNTIVRAANETAPGVGGMSAVSSLPADGTSIAALGAASPDTIVGTRIDKNRFNWVPVSYPASFPGANGGLDNGWQPGNISCQDSVTIGTNQLISLIEKTPGTFALCGMSQGSMVISNVLKALLPGGRLQNRYNDCIGAVAFGNPMRKPGASMPGVEPAPGGGMLSALNTAAPSVSGLGQVNLPPWWWEMCTPGDFFGAAPMEPNALGPISTMLRTLTTAFTAMKGSGGNPIDDITKIVTALLTSTAVPFATVRRTSAVTALRTVGLWLRDLGFFGGLSNPARPVLSGIAMGIVQGVFKLTAAELAPNLLTGNPLYQFGNPHMFYGAWKPPSIPAAVAGRVAANASYVDVALAYLEAQGESITPRGARTRTL